jgi:tRNA nucleotidyltransferase (CCA-adding enzyme)
MRINVQERMSPASQKVVSILSKEGFDAYYVGGCVRDILMHIKPKDFDIASNATPDEVIGLFEDNGFEVHNNGKGMEHGTAIVVVNGEPIEITTFRKEGTYSDGRRPDSVEFVKTIKEDLSRRDFTINAIAVDQHGVLIDPYNGLDDINQKKIRCVGNAYDRLNEDAIRVLRAIRFSCRLGFEIDNGISKVIHYNCKILEDKDISIERIREEICKIVVTDNATDGMRTIISSGLISHIVHEFDYSTMEILSTTTSNDLITRLSCLFIGLDSNLTQDILRRFKFDNDTFYKVSILSHHVNDIQLDPKNRKKIKLLINSLGFELVELFLEIKMKIAYMNNNREDSVNVILSCLIVTEIKCNREPLTLNDLAINGHDVINAGVKPGQSVGKILDYIMDKVLENASLNTREQLLLIIEKIKDIP